MKKKIREFALVTIGAAIVAMGLSFFLIPADLATGGVTGLAMVINHLMPQFEIGSILFVLNAILFVVGFIAIGPQFGAKTIYASFLLSGLVYVFDSVISISGPLVDDLLVNLIVGILISGVGLGIVFNQNASTGGTDIIAKILNKYFHTDIGKSLLMADMVVVLLASFVFGIELAIYALLGVVLNGIIIDNVIEGFSMKVSVSVISTHSQEIQKYIYEELNRGATIYSAKGGYTNSDKEIVNSVMGKKEFVRLKMYVKTVDENAFVTVANVREVLGEGFLS